MANGKPLTTPGLRPSELAGGSRPAAGFRASWPRLTDFESDAKVRHDTEWTADTHQVLPVRSTTVRDWQINQ